MIRFYNCDNISIVDNFINLFENSINRLFPERDIDICIHSLPDSENTYGDIMARINRDIYISEKECGRIGLSDTEILAAISHEVGHILYKAYSHLPDSEQRADTLAAELGLGSQMISVIEKIIDSRRFPMLTSLLVQRIQYLKLIA